MKFCLNWPTKVLTILLLLLFSASVSASRLEVNSSATWLLHIGSVLLLYSHIGGGTIGIFAGLIASLSRKGSHIHCMAGKVFLVSMLVCYFIGALVAPFLDSQQSTNFVAAILALYLLITGVIAAKRKPFIAGRTEIAGLIVAMLITAMGAVYMFMAQHHPEGTVDGSPPQAYILFVVAGGIAAAGELHAILRKELSAVSRTVRHVWRMCMSFFIASGSLFFGQAQFFPQWFNESILPLVFGFFPLLVLISYVLKITLPMGSMLRKKQAA